MKVKTLIMTFALFAAMTGCSKTEISTVVPANNEVTLKAYVNNPATKVGFASDGAFYWSEDDVLGVSDNGTDPSFHEFTLNAEDKGNANGTFTGAFPEGAGFGVCAVYPYNGNHSVSGTTLTYNLPASYTYTNVDGDYFTTPKGTGNSFNAPMLGKIENGSVEMKHLGGVFCIKIADMPCTDGTLTLTSDKKISGTYTVDLSVAEPQIAAAAATDDAEKTVSIAFSGATIKSPGVFYVPAPIGEHDLSIKMVNDESTEQFNKHIGKYYIPRCGLQQIYIVTVNGYAFEMKLVKAGTFLMGSQSADENGQNYSASAESEEEPVHKVTLTDYYIGKYEVTQGLWKAVMDGNNPSTNPAGDDYPVEFVSRDDICTETTGFLARLNSMTGMTFSLPTEAQWEFAAGGGKAGHNADGSRKHLYSGSNNADDVAWHSDNSDGQTHPVGQKQPNELGIYDMSGNVMEWCKDYWSDNYDWCSDGITNPEYTTGDSSSSRIMRGGSWNTGWNWYGEWCCPVSGRHYYNPGTTKGEGGFRLALLP